MGIKIIKLFLRFAIAASFLNASIDRFNDILGILNPEKVYWGNWSNFVAYSAVLMPWFPHWLVVTSAVIATAGEIIFALLLIIGYKTNLIGTLSGVLLLLFAIFMSLTVGLGQALNYSVFSAATAGFALGTIKTKFLELK